MPDPVIPIEGKLTPTQAGLLEAALIRAAVEQFAWTGVETWLDELIHTLNAVSARVKSS